MKVKILGVMLLFALVTMQSFVFVDAFNSNDFDYPWISMHTWGEYDDPIIAGDFLVRSGFLKRTAHVHERIYDQNDCPTLFKIVNDGDDTIDNSNGVSMMLAEWDLPEFLVQDVNFDAFLDPTHPKFAIEELPFDSLRFDQVLMGGSFQDHYYATDTKVPGYVVHYGVLKSSSLKTYLAPAVTFTPLLLNDPQTFFAKLTVLAPGSYIYNFLVSDESTILFPLCYLSQRVDGGCGDGTCHKVFFENEETCPVDCAPVDNCGDMMCDAWLGEDEISCPVDCPPVEYCGDLICDAWLGEDEISCPVDCPPVEYCGDLICDAWLGEDEISCPVDCPL